MDTTRRLIQNPRLSEGLKGARRVKNRLRKLASSVYLRAHGEEHSLHRLRGKMSDTGQTVSIIIAGSQTIVDAYDSFFFGRDSESARIGAVSGLNLKARAVQAAAPKDDLVIWQAWPWQVESDADDIAFEAWSDAVLYLQGDDPEAFLRRHTRSMIVRRLKQYLQAPCELEISTEQADLAEYYHRFYKPLLQARHGKNAHSTFDMRRSFGGLAVTSALMFLKRGGERVAGMFLLHDRFESRLTVQEYGVLQSLVDDAKSFQVIYAGMNFEAIRWAFSHDTRTVSFGGAHNLLKSGVYYYKKQWGTHFERNREREAVGMRFVSDRQPEILQAYPLLVFEGSQPCGRMGYCPSGETVDSADDIMAIVNNYACQNMKRMDVFVPMKAVSALNALPPETWERCSIPLRFAGCLRQSQTRVAREP